MIFGFNDSIGESRQEETLLSCESSSGYGCPRDDPRDIAGKAASAAQSVHPAADKDP